MTSPKIDYTLKFTTFGDICVGKTSIMKRYFDNTFEPIQEKTFGVDYRKKVLKINDKIVEIILFDHMCINPKFTHSFGLITDIIVMVFDVSNIKSFLIAIGWLNEYKKFLITHENFTKIILLLGNKCDNETRQVSTDNATKQAEDLGITYAEISAKTGYGITEAFNNIIFQKIQELEIKKEMMQKLKKHSYCIIA